MVKRVQRRSKNPAKDIVLGLILLVVIESIFMVGGLSFERSQGNPITGIPSSIGLTIAILAGLIFLFKGREYVLIGISLLAFVPPVILFVFREFAPSQVLFPTISYSLGYTTLLVALIYIFLFFKVLRSK